VSSAGCLVDANVLLDVLTADRTWGVWSAEALAAAADAGRIGINPVVYSEVSVGFRRIEDLDSALPPELERLPLPWPAAFLAGKLFVQYRRAGGKRPSPLPDFYIGAHAAVAGMRVLTRDPSPYATYLPALELITP
jgi:predicted nucleic acid-binding protein